MLRIQWRCQPRAHNTQGNRINVDLYKISLKHLTSNKNKEERG